MNTCWSKVASIMGQVRHEGTTTTRAPILHSVGLCPDKCNPPQITLVPWSDFPCHDLCRIFLSSGFQTLHVIEKFLVPELFEVWPCAFQRSFIVIQNDKFTVFDGDHIH